METIYQSAGTIKRPVGGGGVNREVGSWSQDAFRKEFHWNAICFQFFFRPRIFRENSKVLRIGVTLA